MTEYEVTVLAEEIKQKCLFLFVKGLYQMFVDYYKSNESHNYHAMELFYSADKTICRRLFQSDVMTPIELMYKLDRFVRDSMYSINDVENLALIIIQGLNNTGIADYIKLVGFLNDNLWFLQNEFYFRFYFEMNCAYEDRVGFRTQNMANGPIPGTVEPTEREQLISELGQPERVNKYFARAVEEGYMIPTDTGYKWLESKAMLGYFVVWVLCNELARAVPIEQRQVIERIFNVTRLDSTLEQNFGTGKSQAVKRWRAKMDKSIFFD